MSAQAAEPIHEAQADGDVEVAETVVRRMEELNPQQAEAVAHAIAAVSKDKGTPIRIDLPNGPPSRPYKALLPDDPNAPVVIYRSADGGTWLVAALLDRDKYKAYRQAERANLLDDPAFKALIMGALGILGIYLISRAASKAGSPA
jgi:hypothetical protein